MPSSLDAPYQTLPQSEEPDALASSLDSLDGEPTPGPDSQVNSRIKWIFFMFGCALLLSWNALITATPYFLSRLSGSSVKGTFPSYLASSFTAVSLIVIFYSTATSTQASPSRRIFCALLCLAFLTLLLTISIFIHVSPELFFAFVLVNAVLQASAGAYLQPSVIALASMFGPAAVQLVMSGQGAIAVVVSGVQVLSATASVWGTTPRALALYEKKHKGEAEEKSAFIFFFLSTLFLLATTSVLGWLTAMPVYKAVIAPFELRQKQARRRRGDPDEAQHQVQRRRSSISSLIPEGTGQILRIARANWIYEAAVAYAFVVTLSVFPAITTSILSTNPRLHPLLFSAMHFLVFNIGDLGGRVVCAIPRFVTWSANQLLTISLARTVFIPIFLMCNIQRSPMESAITPIINSDIAFMLILLLFGLSNGYISSLCMMGAPSLEHNPRLKGKREDVHVAATLASFCLMGGLAIGSFASFGVRAIICSCNPFTQ